VPRPLTAALADLRGLLLDDGLVRAVATGRRRGQPAPDDERVEIRPVSLRSGPHLQVLSRTGPRVSTNNAARGPVAQAAVDGLLDQPFANWHVETAAETVQLRVTKRGDAQLHRAVGPAEAASGSQTAPASHDRVKAHLLDPGDPLFSTLGAGADKRRQVDAFVRLLAPAAGRALEGSAGRELRVVDLGCGNAYLTFAAHRWLTGQAAELAVAVHTVGVDVREDLVERSRRLGAEAGLPGLDFTVGSIATAEPLPAGQTPDVVLALHACDTATDEALARAVRWRSPLVLAAPCCHRDVQRQLRGSATPFPALTRHGILRERLADVLTDALRALVLRMLGYRVDVVEFVDSAHTPRNALLRAVLTGAPPSVETVAEYRDLTSTFGVHPALARMLEPEIDAVLAGAPG